jgi:HK97 family phage prohead protease
MKDRRSDHCLKAGTQSSDSPFDFILSSDTPDRVGDVIDQKGWSLKAFKENPVALFGHQHDFPIGVWKNARVVGNKLIARLEMAEKGTSDRIDEIRALIEQRVLKAVSVGFRVLDYEPMDEKDPWGAWLIKKAELLETSIVTVPANPDALSLAKSLGVSKGTQRLVFGTGTHATSILSQPAKAAPADYSDLIGTPSETLRRRRLIY